MIPGRDIHYRIESWLPDDTVDRWSPNIGLFDWFVTLEDSPDIFVVEGTSLLLLPPTYVVAVEGGYTEIVVVVR